MPPAPDVPEPPFFGVRRLGPEEIDLREVYACFDLRSLFRLSWGVPSEKEKEFKPALARWQKEAIERRLLVPRAAYGYFRCRREGDAVVVLPSEETSSAAARFEFPRQEAGEGLCLADYFREDRDTIALAVVTVGPAASEEVERLQRAGRYADAHALHGFSTQAAEALAEWLHRRVRRELRIDPRRGLRFSFGYPACPELSDQEKLCALVGAREIGVELTAAWQLVPEQSTSALIVHHPAAKYFSAVVAPERA